MTHIILYLTTALELVLVAWGNQQHSPVLPSPPTFTPVVNNSLEVKIGNPDSITVREGIQVTINCKPMIDFVRNASGVNPRVVWYKNGIILTNGSEVNVYISEDDRLVVISQTSVAEAGQLGTSGNYTCCACIGDSNGDLNVDCTCNSTVKTVCGEPHLVPPANPPTIMPTFISLTFGQNVTAPTLVGVFSLVIALNIFNGSQPLNTTFYKDGSVIMSSSSTSLIISNPTDDNFGIYTVIVSSESCGAAYAISRICQSGIPPQIDKGFGTILPPIIMRENQRFKIGDQAYVFKDFNVTFDCNVVNGTSPITILWLHNDVEISSMEGNSSTITITDAEDGDNVSCRAVNSIGFDEATSTIRVEALHQLDKFCEQETKEYNYFSITWNRTFAGVSVEAPCTGVGLSGFVHRRCISGNEWEEYIQCYNKELNKLLNLVIHLSSILYNLNDTEIISITGNIAAMLANLTAKPIFAKDLSLSVSIITLLNNVTASVAATLHANNTFFEDTVTVLDNLLNVNNEDNWQQLLKTSPNTSQHLVTGIEHFGRLLEKTLTNYSASVVKTRPNIVLKANLVSNESIKSGQPYMFSTKDSNTDSNFTGGDIVVMLSNNILKSVFNQLLPNIVDFTVSGSAIRDNALQLPNFNNETINQLPASSIASVQLPVNNFHTSANDPIVILFDNVTLLSTSQSRTCSFYNDTLRGIDRNEFGGWSTNGVELDEEQSTESKVVCQAYHLTSFAVLVSIQDEQSPSTSADQALSIISYVGCAISLLCLCISIIILSIVIHRKKKKINNLFVHLNLCIALALGLIVFITGIEPGTKHQGSCTAVAVLLHYFFTSAFCWMLCEGIMLYMMLITVFGNKLNHKWFFMILGWSPAIPIVAISVGIAHEHYGADHYCWIKSDDGAIFAFIVPIVVIVMINCVFIAFTLKVLCVDSSKLRDENITNKAKEMLKAVIILLPLLGVTWIIGILAVNEDTAAFAWIFAILNSLQGVLIFILHVLRNKVIRKEIGEHYNFWKSSRVYSFYSRFRSGRYSSSTSTIGISFKRKVSQSNTFGYEKKVISEKSTTEADEGHTKSHKDASETPLDDNVFEMKLTTLATKDENAIVETTVNDDDNIRETSQAVLEKQDISPTANTVPTVSLHAEN